MVPINQLINISSSFMGITMAVLGILIIRSAHYLDRTLRKHFMIFFSIILGYISFVGVSMISMALLGPEFTILSKISMFLYSLLSSMLMPGLMHLLLLFSGEDRSKCPEFYICIGLWLIYFLLLVITQFSTFIYYFSSNNEYHRGPFYSVLLVPPALMMAVNLYALLKRRKRLSVKQFSAFLCYLLIPLASMILQIFITWIYLISIATTVAAMIMLMFILSEQRELYDAQQKQLIKQKSDILMLQIRPHFVYNTMSSIYYLCKIDADKAQQVVGDFTTYLRRNFSAISKNELIPFSDELEHTSAYLAVEKARYEELLNIETNIKETNFRLPPLTLQPIVENAVKHGVDPELSPLYISITTEKNDSGYRIIVENSGTEFKAPSDDEVHIGIDNVRERLGLMCNGTLDITPREGGGAVVTITVPESD